MIRRAIHRLNVLRSRLPIYLPYRFRPVSGERYFCQNSGSCGSKYIVELFEANGLGPSFHEKTPDLDVFGIDYFEGKVSNWRARAVLLQTRRNVFFEANNRLFAMSGVIREAFPDARFIHLHRDPRDYLPSSLSKPPALTWESGRRRYTIESLCGSLDASILEKACTYWARYNQRILNDLENFDHLSLKSADLFTGRVDALEKFVGHRFHTRTLAPVNADKPVREEGRHPPFRDWSREDRETLHRICGPLMAELGYGVEIEGPYTELQERRTQ